MFLQDKIWWLWLGVIGLLFAIMLVPLSNANARTYQSVDGAAQQAGYDTIRN